MASKTQKTETIRDRKSAPNKKNRKTDATRLRENLEVINRLKEENRK